MAQVYHTPTSSVSSIVSPAVSVWSHGHSSKSSTSSMSITSSPVQARDSLDLFGPQKRLEDVREEEDISSRHMRSFDDYKCGDSSEVLDRLHLVSPALTEYSLSDDMDVQSAASSQHHQPKRHRSARNTVTSGFASRFGSLSRRWRNRSATGPPLSIITNTTPIASPRSSFDPFANHSRSASIASNAYNIYSPASMHSFVDETIPESKVVPIYIDQRLQLQHEEEVDRGQATTPLLPPTMLCLKTAESPVQSPLQSPSIAATAFGTSKRFSMDAQPLSYLPSPPLSTQPSLVCMPRSRANTGTQDVPSLHLLSERLDPWAVRLGHADFSIHPEPYQPNIIDIDNYREFRENWDQARKQYAQHLARTIEHYGETSKVYKLTEEKWSSIDQLWKGHDSRLALALSPQLARLSDGSNNTPDSPVSLLEKPVTRVVVPTMDKGGKFPEIGDTDIVGPLTIGVAKVPELQRGNITPPISPTKKRNFIKALGDIFKAH